MIPVLIIGYGNPLRSDDGIGWRAAQALLTVWPSTQVRVEVAHQLLPEMADWIADAEFVVFIDACWDSVPGRIRSHAVHPEVFSSSSMTHRVSPKALLAAARQLFHVCPEAVIVSVGGDSFDYGEALSKNSQAAFPAVLTHIEKLVQGSIARTNGRKAAHHA